MKLVGGLQVHQHFMNALMNGLVAVFGPTVNSEGKHPYELKPSDRPDSEACSVNYFTIHINKKHVSRKKMRGFIAGWRAAVRGISTNKATLTPNEWRAMDDVRVSIPNPTEKQRTAAKALVAMGAAYPLCAGCGVAVDVNVSGTSKTRMGILCVTCAKQHHASGQADSEATGPSKPFQDKKALMEADNKMLAASDPKKMQQAKNRKDADKKRDKKKNRKKSKK